jgi:hypothetical protein
MRTERLRAMLNKILSFLKQFTSLAPIFNFIGGRHTVFAIFFAGTGFYLELHGKLTTDYVGLITALQALVLAHSAKEDYFNSK